jgi:hypothetical protein
MVVPGAGARPAVTIDEERIADAVEELRRLPRSDALTAALHVLEALPRVGTVMVRRKSLRLWDELWASGEFWTRDQVDRAVARRVGRAPETVRGWRWERDVFGTAFGQQGAEQDELARSEPNQEPR